MAEVRVEGDQLVVHVRGMDRLWALKSELTIPLSDVVGAEADAEDAKEWLHGIRTGGTHIPGVISAGRFHSHGERVFWDVHDADKAVAIQLENWEYTRLVVQVDDPAATVADISKAVGQ